MPRQKTNGGLGGLLALIVVGGLVLVAQDVPLFSRKRAKLEAS